MSNAPISNNNALARAAERVRATREAERAGKVVEGEIIAPVKTTTQVRAPLNDFPDNDTLASRISGALAALSRGIRWARGSILNLLV
jgi:hypothetical protein